MPKKNKKAMFAALQAQAEDEKPPETEALNDAGTQGGGGKKGKRGKKVKGGAFGKKNPKADDDDDFVDPIAAAAAEVGGDEDATPAPAPMSNSQRKKEKKNKKKGRQQQQNDGDDDDDIDPIAAAMADVGLEDEDDAALAPAPMSNSQRKKEKKKSKKKGRQQFDDDDDDDIDPIAAALAAAELGDADEDKDEDDADNEADESPPETVGMIDETEGDDEDVVDDADDEEPAQASSGFAALMDDDEDDSDNDTAEKKKKKDKKKKKKDVAELEGTDDVAAEDGAEKKDKKKKKKKKDVSELEAADEAAAEDGDEKKKKKKKKKDVSELEGVSEDGEAEKKEKKKKKKKKDLSELEVVGAEGDQEGEGASVAEPSAEPKLDKNGKPKKLSNKARRKMAAEKEAQEREREFQEVCEKESSQFSCSQDAVDESDPYWQNALDIKISSFTISAPKKTLFENASLSIRNGGRYGLVGPNGHGKTTLLKMIELGELKLPPKIDYLYVEQEVKADDTPAVDAVLKADEIRWNLVMEEKEILRKLEVEKVKDVKLDERLGVIYTELANMNADSAESKARRILSGLGFTVKDQSKATKHFSGGWRMRISLAKALFIEPTLLMLDEPTNHLDLNAVIWLDDYLQKYKKTVLVISHDQDFLNSVCEEILHLYQLKVNPYKGNYDTFKKMHETMRKQQLKAYEKQEKRLRELKKANVSKGKAEAQVKKTREMSAKAAKKKNKGQMEENVIQELIQRPKDYTVKLHFKEPPDLVPPILEVRDVNWKWKGASDYLFKDLNFGITMEDRICIAGPNGVGKSTLLNLMTGDLEPEEGEVKRNRHLRIGRYNQHFADKLPMEQNPVEYLMSSWNLTYQESRNLLGKVGLGGHAHEVKHRDLSGGQKARVVFAYLMCQTPHILFLDEPTNNLDIETIDALCEAIRNFEGGVVVVSHDARLIETTECRLWVVGDQTVEEFDGEFYEYRQMVLDELEEAQAEADKKIQAQLEAKAKLAAERKAALASSKK